MQSEQRVEKGEYRRLTPEEIGELIRRIRKEKELKQINLAHEARVDERTVQRIERGDKASDDSLRKLASALHLDEKLFVEPLYVPTADEMDSAAKRALAEFTVIEAHGLKKLSDCESVLTAWVHCIDDDVVSESLADHAAEFKDTVNDWGDVYHDLSHAERLAACRGVLAAGENVGVKGYKILYGAYTTEDRWKFKVAVVLFLHADDGLSSKVTQLVVPRTLHGLKNAASTGMVWENLGGRVSPPTTGDELRTTDN